MDINQDIIKEEVLITAEALTATGWKKYGNAWYKIGTTKGITNCDGAWQKWCLGKAITVTKMSEL